MAETIPDGEPTALVAGDTWRWTKRLDSYAPTESGGTWTLSYSIAGATTLPWDAAWVTVTGNVWGVTIPASATGGLTAGRYQWAAIVTGGGGYTGQRFTPESGVFAITANPADLADGDAVRFAETQLAAVEAVLANRITADLQNYSIAGRAVTMIPVAELMALRTRLQYEVFRLRNPGRAGPRRLIQFTAS